MGMTVCQEGIVDNFFLILSECQSMNTNGTIPFPTFSHIFLPLFTTTIPPVAIVRLINPPYQYRHKGFFRYTDFPAKNCINTVEAAET